LFSFARKTPFTVPGILEEAKKLLAFGFSAEELVPTLNMIGNIAAGVGKDKLPFLVKALADVRGLGRLMQREVLQFANSGVAIIPELSKKYGKSSEQIMKMIEGGQISYQDVLSLLKGMTTGNGRFANLMIKQSKTLSGLLSNAYDFAVLFSSEVGEALLPAAKAFVSEVLNWVEANRELILEKSVHFMRMLARFLKEVWITTKFLVMGLYDLAQIFGGVEKSVKLLTLALISFLALSLVSRIGVIGIAIWELVTAIRAVGVAALFAEGVILGIPALIGALIIAALLLAEDVLSFFQGRNSFTEIFVGWIKDGFQKLKDFVSMVENFVSSIIDKIKTKIKDVFNFKKIAGFGLEFFSGMPIGTIQNIQSPPTFSPTTNSSQTSVVVSSPVTVNVPAGTPSGDVGHAVKSGIHEALGDVFRATMRNSIPSVSY